MTVSECSFEAVPKRPGTPEVAQTYNNTALVLWKPADTKSPCSYTLEKNTEGDPDWTTVATGVTDCYYNVTDLPPGSTLRFRVTCSNKAGQGPSSNCSGPVSLDPAGGGATPATTEVKTVPVQPQPVPEPEVKPVQNTPRTVISTSSPPKGGAPPLSQTELGLSRPPSSAENPPKPSEDSHKSPSFPSSPLIKIPPPLITPKPQSPVNVVSPLTKTPPILPPPPVTAPLTPTKPCGANIRPRHLHGSPPARPRLPSSFPRRCSRPPV
ncbi:hypothetical protein fugu_002306 [Takifugu bimaculatus]|uniref:Fibronectin type-III domain-containing protein n=1 Tax=Takifugu bimaculatus TaxID=433685 RepID=A0A4Z2BS52_9TELE|nr:hypothetical protein fugu_002306 [Takifugu bimaculatus]